MPVVDANFPFLLGAKRDPSDTPMARRDYAIYY